MITVSTDGSCLRNPGGAIGWAWVGHGGRSASGGAVSGTNQIAELTAVHEAIEAHPGAEPLHIEADSQYAIKCASVWVAGWRRKGWRTASGGPVQNLALVQAIERAIAERPGPVTFGWVRGHVGDRFNEEADRLAGVAAREAQAGRPTAVRVLAPAQPPAPAPRTAPDPGTRAARGGTGATRAIGATGATGTSGEGAPTRARSRAAATTTRTVPPDADVLF